MLQLLISENIENSKTAFEISKRVSYFMKLLVIYLDESDGDDEERWREATVVVSVILPVPLLRQKLVRYQSRHPAINQTHLLFTH
jgi:hypothetical protein